MQELSVVPSSSPPATPQPKKKKKQVQRIYYEITLPVRPGKLFATKLGNQRLVFCSPILAEKGKKIRIRERGEEYQYQTARTEKGAWKKLVRIVDLKGLKSPDAANQRKRPVDAGQRAAITRALYDHKAEAAGELDFKKGDLIEVIEKTPSGWWKGRLNGKIGVFPGNYTCQVRQNSASVTPVHAKRPFRTAHKHTQSFALALFEHRAEEPGELTFAEGETIIVKSKHESGWWTGLNESGEKGIFPANYIIEEQRRSSIVRIGDKGKSKSWASRARKRYANARASTRRLNAHRKGCCEQIFLFLRLAIPCWAIYYGDLDFGEDEDSRRFGYTAE